jgi:hypothetical protein
MISNTLFETTQPIPYPPFKNGLYLEEYFCKVMAEKNPALKRKYIPVKWTNFQIANWFPHKMREMQHLFDEWVRQNPSDTGYFTVVQHDDGPMLCLPPNTIIYGACSGDIPIPLIYQDLNNTLESYPKKRFSDKKILCSFVGNITSDHVQPNVRDVMFKKLSFHPKCKIFNSGGWAPSVKSELQTLFIDTTLDSKFALAPRGYGRSSFRFFECFQLGTIPIYLWNDACWLPFQDKIDYKKLCINMHISEIDTLLGKLEAITEDEYNAMIAYYETIKHFFQLDGMTDEIISKNV